MEAVWAGLSSLTADLQKQLLSELEEEENEEGEEEGEEGRRGRREGRGWKHESERRCE